MRIESLRLKNWGRFLVVRAGQIEIPLKPGINVLVGGNGTGKSTLIGALRFALTGSRKAHPGITQGQTGGGAAVAWADQTLGHFLSTGRIQGVSLGQYYTREAMDGILRRVMARNDLADPTALIEIALAPLAPWTATPAERGAVLAALDSGGTAWETILEGAIPGAVAFVKEHFSVPKRTASLGDACAQIYRDAYQARRSTKKAQAEIDETKARTKTRRPVDTIQADLTQATRERAALQARAAQGERNRGAAGQVDAWARQAETLRETILALEKTIQKRSPGEKDADLAEILEKARTGLAEIRAEIALTEKQPLDGTCPLDSQPCARADVAQAKAISHLSELREREQVRLARFEGARQAMDTLTKRAQTNAKAETDLAKARGQLAQVEANLAAAIPSGPPINLEATRAELAALEETILALKMELEDATGLETLPDHTAHLEMLQAVLEATKPDGPLLSTAHGPENGLAPILCGLVASYTDGAWLIDPKTWKMTIDGVQRDAPSDSEAITMAALVQAAISQVIGLRVIALDRLEALDPAHKKRLIGWLYSACAAGDLDTCLLAQVEQATLALPPDMEFLHFIKMEDLA
jgi:hypothetical protein